MRPAPIVNVVRYLLLDKITYLALPWAWAAFGFLIDVVVLQLTPAGHQGGHRWVAGLAPVFIFAFVQGTQTVARALPFGLALGASRRTYYLGAASLAAALGASFGLLVALGQIAERATGGWGMNMAYFRVPYLLSGSWYQSWLTAAVAFVLLFAYGTWYGLVYRRGGMVGTVIFGGAQVAVLALAAVLTTWAHDWAGLGRFLTAITAAGLTAILAAGAAVLLTGGLATIRRLTV
ncbi:MAG TPA: hypothetical protein VGG35_00785 [Streptosporangiaceae bacterium]|jgi:hypothetical protein